MPPPPRWLCPIPCEELQKEKISKIVDLIIAESTKDYKEKVQKEEIQENELSMSINQDKDDIIAKRPRLFAYIWAIDGKPVNKPHYSDARKTTRLDQRPEERVQGVSQLKTSGEESLEDVDGTWMAD
ncbi:hypothetical protein Hamer_G028040 [Homarus americanus]|uniref:Uncharacterized protein n=1 Tax=Homarus americanus TaxID=6706 RepID=A0A8J5JMA3_HOMAM|nr:hypothetical protein Hamer_G028040 [Homarus americanus]